MPRKDKPRHVLLVSEYFFPHWTGLANSFKFLSQQLVHEGHTVEVITTHFDPTTAQHELWDNVHITRVPFQLKISRTHYSFQIIWEYAKMLPRFDTVIVNSPNSNILFYSLLAKILRKKLIIYHQADILLPRQTGNLLVHIVIEKIFELCTIPSMFLADAVSSFTQDYARFSRVMRYFLYKFFAYIPPVTLSQQAPHASFAKKVDDLGRKHTLIGISGRFVEEKGFDILFQALPFILNEVPDAHIVFAGKKIIEYEPFYERHRMLFDGLARHISYLGFLDKGNYAYFYKKLDVFVLSSRIECFALTQIEALQARVPIVVTDVAGARQLVKNSGFGEIVARENPQALAQGIIKVLKNRTHYTKNHVSAERFLSSHSSFILK